MSQGDNNSTGPADTDLKKRLVELELRSEERREDMARLDSFVRGFEARISTLEQQVDALKEALLGRPDAPPDPEKDLPPHY